MDIKHQAISPTSKPTSCNIPSISASTNGKNGFKSNQLCDDEGTIYRKLNTISEKMALQENEMMHIHTILRTV